MKLLNGKEERRKFEADRRAKLEQKWGESWEDRDARLATERAEADAVGGGAGVGGEDGVGGEGEDGASDAKSSTVVEVVE